VAFTNGEKRIQLPYNRETGLLIFEGRTKNHFYG